MNSILLLMSTKKLILILAAAFLVLSLIFICLMIWTKGWVRALIFTLGFAVFFVGLYVAGYNYFYEYPQGILDRIEREDGALNYWEINKVQIDDKNMIYFTKDKNGQGSKVHIGIVKSSWPKYINHFSCESTSSCYCETNQIIYDETTDGTYTYLAGVLAEKGISKVVITFDLGNNQTKVYEGQVTNNCFYILDFDGYHAGFISKIEGFNKDGVLFFTRWQDKLQKGVGSKLINDPSSEK